MQNQGTHPGFRFGYRRLSYSYAFLFGVQDLCWRASAGPSEPAGQCGGNSTRDYQSLFPLWKMNLGLEPLIMVLSRDHVEED